MLLVESSASTFIDELKKSFELIVCTNGSLAKVDAIKTNYVIPGCLFKIKSNKSDYLIWFGLNGPRLFYITYLPMSKEKALDSFKFCFGGAEKVGWQFNYEPIEGLSSTSIWGTCMTNTEKSLIDSNFNSDFSPRSVKSEITEYGIFWVTDIAMMAQSFVRTCERLGVSSLNQINPAPL